MAVLASSGQLQSLLGQLAQGVNNVRHLASGRLFGNQEHSFKSSKSTEDGYKLLGCDQCDEIVSNCLSVLRHTSLHPVTLQGSPSPHWRQSYKSADTFHENIHGPPTDSKLESDVQEVCAAILGPNRRLLSPNLVHSVLQQQFRGFKTKRSSSTGFSKARDQKTPLARIETLKIPSTSFNSKLGLTKDLDSDTTGTKFSKIYDSDLTDAEQNELKIAFADGYHANWKNIMGNSGKLNSKDMGVMAFAEGYLASKKSGKPEKKNRILSTLASTILITLIIGVAALLISNVSIKKVQLINTERFEVSPETVSVMFEDVRGCDEAKSEMRNIVDFLKNPKKYTDLGAKLPNGCLLVGPPGVGKTMLAKAVAGEANVPFFQASGAEFDEIYVGTGAKRVRQLFTAAKAKAPCVVFIDEIDSVGGKRTSSEMHPYANQTINQLLTEMDGFQTNEGIIVLGATNKRENLDKALLRPGRFDVEVNISVPDLKGRQEILQLYLPKIKTDGNLDTLSIAKQTTGCTGADLYNICNHAAMKAAVDGMSAITIKDIEYAIDKVRMGPQKKRLAEQVVNRMTAYHEAGHAIVRFFCSCSASKLHKITILPRGHSLGMTHFIYDEKREFQYTKEEMMYDMDALMGGRIAEEIIFGEDQVSTGASSDMSRASTIAEDMVKRYGFSDKAGLRVYSSSSQNPISSKLQEDIDDEIKRILKESYDRAKKLLLSKKKELCFLAEALFEYEELSYEEAKIVIEGGKLNRPESSPRPPQPPTSPDDPKSNKEEKRNGSVNLLATRKY